MAHIHSGSGINYNNATSALLRLSWPKSTSRYLLSTDGRRSQVSLPTDLPPAVAETVEQIRAMPGLSDAASVARRSPMSCRVWRARHG